MNDLASYHGQEQEIARLKKELKEAKAEIRKLKVNIDNKKEAITASKLRVRSVKSTYINKLSKHVKVARLIGSGVKSVDIIRDLNVSSATIATINKLIN